MRTSTFAFALWAILSFTVGCGGGDATATPAPTNTLQPTSTPDILQARTGVYSTNDVGALPLPISGYDIYVIGESHGQREGAQLFLAYLHAFHDAVGLRDIVLEEDQVYEEQANAYVLGDGDALRVDLCLRTNLLDGVRTLNASLSADEKIHVHLVDVDSPLPAIHAHFQALHDRLGEAAQHIEMPTMDEFEWNNDGLGKHRAMGLLEQLEEAAAGRDSVINQLGSLRFSLNYYYAGNRIGIGPPEGSVWSAPIREDAITHNIQYLVDELNGAPLLAFFGRAHAQKSQGIDPPVRGLKSWAHRLTEAGVNVYSLAIWGVSGKSYWRGTESQDNTDTGQMRFADGSSIAAVLDGAPDHNIVYVDLRLAANASVRLGEPYKDMPAGEIYDGMVLFRSVTPMEDACP